ncbi:MAG: NAD(P)H-hydrate dehydratase [Clostridia bacterium]|nr:NAD(P)H-hydrate dehydratase [Clostridia bacterium]
MRILSVKEIREMEEIANDKIMSFTDLMESAGTACAEAILHESYIDAEYCIVVGKGKNGGDGLVIARKLYQEGLPVSVVFVDGVPKDSDSALMYEKAKKLDIEFCNYLDDREKGRQLIENSFYIIDCIFGIGFHGKPDEKTSEIIDLINFSDSFVFSIDIPSGISSDSPLVGANAVKSDYTITISTLKKATVFQPSSEYCGTTQVVQIGITKDCYKNAESNCESITAEEAKFLLPKRTLNSHKGDFGKLLIIAGSKPMPGAAALSTGAALNSGAGLVTLGCHEDVYRCVSNHYREATYVPINYSTGGTLRLSENLKLINEKIISSDAIIFGPGIGISNEAKQELEKILSTADCPVVIDADGLNLLAENKEVALKTKAKVILTPHPGEMSRLTGLSIDEIEKDRLNVCQKLADELNATVVLKGANTVVCDSESKLKYINATGNPGMATAGSGDVLSGILGSFLAQGMNAYEAAKIAVYIHGIAGDFACLNKTQISMKAGDIIDYLPDAFFFVADEENIGKVNIGRKEIYEGI